MNGQRNSFTFFVALSVSLHTGLAMLGIFELPSMERKKEILHHVTLVHEEVKPEPEPEQETKPEKIALPAQPQEQTPKTEIKKVKIRKIVKPRKAKLVKRSSPKKPKPRIQPTIAKQEKIEPKVQPAAVTAPAPRPPDQAPSSLPSESSFIPMTNILPEAKAVCADDDATRKKAKKDWKKSYKRKVYSRIQRAKRYPYAARRDGIEGRVVVKFTINRSGRVSSVRVVKGTPHSILNSDAVAWVKRAAPFPPFPSGAEELSLSLSYGLRYDLK